MIRHIYLGLMLGIGAFCQAADVSAPAASATLLQNPLSLQDCLEIGLRQNPSILKSKSGLEAAHGIVLQTKSIVFPKVRGAGNYQLSESTATETFPFPGAPVPNDHQWSGNVRLVQSIYEGGRISSSLRTARLTREQALLNHQTLVADSLLSIRVAYEDALLAAEQIIVQEASVKLLEEELATTRRRLAAGTTPQYNVLRAEVEAANARPRLIRARQASRTARNNLIQLLGFNFPANQGEEPPLKLKGELKAEPFEIELMQAVNQALTQRSEISALQKNKALRRESIEQAKAGYKPSVQGFAGYGSRSATFTSDLTRDISGWFVGAQLSWDIFDGQLTRGKVVEARALFDQSDIELVDTARKIELEVRTAHSSFVEAREVLESQTKAIEWATEVLRLANARVEAGTATQLDVLSAQTALTEARNIQIQALRDYSVARARLERAVGNSLRIDTSRH